MILLLFSGDGGVTVTGRSGRSRVFNDPIPYDDEEVLIAVAARRNL